MLEEKNKKGQGYGLYGYTNSNDQIIDDYETTNSRSGNIVIKKIDTVNQIVAGTFFYDAVNQKGEVVKITNGRFDVRYKQ